MNALQLYTIYDHPADHPDGFVVRRFEVEDGKSTAKESLGTAPTLEEARGLVPPGLFNLGREAGDSPSIAETWI